MDFIEIDALAEAHIKHAVEHNNPTKPIKIEAAKLRHYLIGRAIECEQNGDRSAKDYLTGVLIILNEYERK